MSTCKHSRSFVPGFTLATLLALGWATGAGAAVGVEQDRDARGEQAQATIQKKTGYTRSRAVYTIPDVTLVDMDGKPYPLRRGLDAETPVMLNFVFTTCTAICPIMSAVFSNVQNELGPEQSKPRLISISLDPDFDTPATLKAYAARHHAGPNWRMLTGSKADILEVVRAFDAWRGQKMNHTLTTYLRGGPNQPWVRLDGLATPADLVREYRSLPDAPAVAQTK
jgi:protein SCO1/2